MNASCTLPDPPLPGALALEEGPPAALTGDVVEIPLLLSGRQMSALEMAAHRRGLTAAEMVRQLLREFIAGQPMRTA